MAKKRKKYKPKGLLGAIPLAPTKPLTNNELAILAAALAGGTLAGISIPKPYYLAGIPVAILGVVKKNMYITTAGVALTLTGGFKSYTEGVNGIEGLDGVKERLMNYFKNFGEGIPFLKKAEEQQSVGSLGEQSNEEQVSYFTNPYNELPSNTNIDLSPLDRLQEQIEAMNGGLSDLDISDRNF